MSEEIIIIGNSFSGLGAAIAFAKYGHRIKVIAPNNKPQLFGGIQIAPNSLAALSSSFKSSTCLRNSANVPPSTLEVYACKRPPYLALNAGLCISDRKLQNRAWPIC